MSELIKTICTITGTISGLALALNLFAFGSAFSPCNLTKKIQPLELARYRQIIECSYGDNIVSDTFAVVTYPGAYLGLKVMAADAEEYQQNKRS